MSKGSKKQVKRGIFFGTFDPIHNGHIHIAQNIKVIQDLDSVLILPLFASPHKGSTVSVEPIERYKMCELACRDIEGLDASCLELNQEMTGYSIKMVDVIIEAYPKDKLYYIIGSDIFLSIMKWVSLTELIKRVTFCVAIRNHEDVEKVLEVKDVLEQIGGETCLCEFDILDLSSTRVRECIRDEKCISEMVPQSVVTYINENKLYQ